MNTRSRKKQKINNLQNINQFDIENILRILPTLTDKNEIIKYTRYNDPQTNLKTLDKVINSKNIDAINIILDKDPDILFDLDRSFRPPLIKYVIEENIEIIELLLKKNSSKRHIHIRDFGGKTALMHSMYCKSDDICKLLLKFDSTQEHLEIKDIDNRTVLFYAVLEKKFDRIKLLLNINESLIFIKNKDSTDQNVIDLCNSTNFTEGSNIIKLFENEFMHKFKFNRYLTNNRNKNNEIIQIINDIKLILSENSDLDILLKLKKLNFDYIFNSEENRTKLIIRKVHMNFLYIYNLILSDINRNEINNINLYNCRLASFILYNHRNFGGGPLAEYFNLIQETLKSIGNYRILKLKKKNTELKQKNNYNAKISNIIKTKINNVIEKELKVITEEMDFIIENNKDIPKNLFENGIEPKVFWNIIHISNYNIFNYDNEFNTITNDTNINITPEILYALSNLPENFLLPDDPKFIQKFCFYLLINIFECKKKNKTQFEENQTQFEENDILISLINSFLEKDSNELEKAKKQLKLLTDKENKNTNDNSKINILKNVIKEYNVSLNTYCNNELITNNKFTDFYKSIVFSNTKVLQLLEITKLIILNLDIEPIQNTNEGSNFIIELYKNYIQTKNITDSDILNLFNKFVDALEILFNKTNYKIIQDFLKLITGLSNKPRDLKLLIGYFDKHDRLFVIHTCFNRIDLNLLVFFNTENINTNIINPTNDMKRNLNQYYIYLKETLQLKELNNQELAQKLGLLLFNNDYFLENSSKNNAQIKNMETQNMNQIGGHNKTYNIEIVLLTIIIITSSLLSMF